MEAATVRLPSVIELNVGGSFFTTCLTTLTKDDKSRLWSMFSGSSGLIKDSQGRFFIDRDRTHFSHVLNFLRHDKLPPAHLAVDILDDAEFYKIQGLITWCKQQDGVVLKQVKEGIFNVAGFSSTSGIMSVRLLGDIILQLLKSSPSSVKTSIVLTGSHNTIPEVSFSQDIRLAVVVARTSRSSTLKSSPFFCQERLPTSCAVLGRRPDHVCIFSRSSGHFTASQANVAVFCDYGKFGNVAVDTIFQQLDQAVTAFNALQAGMQLGFTRVTPPERSQSSCTLCAGQIFMIRLQLTLSDQKCHLETGTHSLFERMSLQLDRFKFSSFGGLRTSG